MSTPLNRALRNTCGLALLALLLALTACGGSGGGPTAPSSQLTMTRAAVMINGQMVNGMTLSRSHDSATGTRFEAKLMQMDGQPAVGGSVQVQHQGPGMGMMSTTFMLYDDGTHGDMMAGDGVYSYDDMREDYGCGGTNAAMGDYHYTFMGSDGQGHKSNSMAVTVTITQ